jgi:hypothetical protein
VASKYAHGPRQRPRVRHQRLDNKLVIVPRQELTHSISRMSQKNNSLNNLRIDISSDLAQPLTSNLL